MSTAPPLQAGGPPVEYPDSDGQPMAENTLQFQWIVTIEGGLDAVFRDDPNVFVAGDLLWYPVEGDPTIRQAPDALAVFGRPKGYRGSYRQWEEDDIPPQVVFEVLSPGNRAGEMARKHEFYERYGVEEYYAYDPDRVTLKGWRRAGDVLREIPAMNGWVSPRLGIRFDMSGPELRIFGPDGRPFATYLELVAQREEAERVQKEARRQTVEAQRQAAEAQRQAAEAQQQAAEAQQETAEAQQQTTEAQQQAAEAQRQTAEAQQQAAEAQARAERLAAQLRAAGIEPQP